MRALPFVQVEIVRGDIWIVIRRISFGLRPSLRRFDRARRSVLLNELMVGQRMAINCVEGQLILSLFTFASVL